MFIDEITFNAKAGDGGDGVVRWRHEKFVEFGGPSGGDGGKGGDVYVKAVRDVGLLARYKNIKKFKAGCGGDGEDKRKHGAGGRDLDILLPVGSVVKNLSSDREFELLKEGERVLILHGGAGGKGNNHFKSSTNVRPYQFTRGKAGEGGSFFVELRLFAAAGIIGLPNAGKSSLLNELTNANAKVGSYEFTTLEPNLGNFYGYILADIPGLIEGASEGKGLGHKFLRHIERTKILLHCISLENEKMLETYKIVRNELKAHNPAFVEKPEAIVLTKSDTVSSAEEAKKRKQLLKKSPNIFSVSIIDENSLKKFKKNLTNLLRTCS